MSGEDSPSSPNPTGRAPARVSGPSRSGATVHVGAIRTKIISIQLKKLTFKTDHHMMTDNRTNWKNTGSPIPKPEWTLGNLSHPVSHTKEKAIEVDLEFDVQPPNADVTIADVIGKAELKKKVFHRLFYIFAATNKKFKGGTVTVRAVLKTGAPPDKVQILSGDIAWSVKTRDDGDFDAGSSEGHDIFFTMNTPVKAPGREAGITWRRMRNSVRLIEDADSNDPHEIASHLQNLFPGYTLTPDPAVPAEFHHPQYFAQHGQVESGAGAWPAADFLMQTAECQAIIRFVRAAMLQVGCPGTMPIVVVWSDPNDHAKVKEGDWDKGAGGLAGVTKVVKGKLWWATLADKDVEEGDLIDPGAVGFNNFEACLKLTHGGKTMYYGGGAGDFPTKEEVIEVFTALCWVSTVVASNGQRKTRIEKIVKRYS